MTRTSYTFSNDAETIRRILKKMPAYEAVLDKARTNTEYAAAHFDDHPQWISGWGHDFCCPQCASQMKFDVTMPYNPPNTFVCPHCGATAQGKAYDEAWVYSYRSYFAGCMFSAAICTILGDDDALAYMIRYMDFYAEHYDRFPVHGRHAGVGKVMEQGLDEAVWAITLIRALYACGERIPAEKKAFWMEKLFRPMTELLIPQCNRIHNIPTWLLCAIGMIGMYFEDEALLKYALDDQNGLRRQIAEGFTADGIWYEGSMTYHYYTVRALTFFFSMYAEKAPTDALMDTFAKMYTAPLVLSFDGYHLPALNDGWYPNAMSDGVLIASRICADPVLEEAVEHMRRASPRAFLTPEALLFLRVEEDIVVLADTNLAVIRKPFHVILKSGVLAESHRHRDYLSTSISPFSDDLGTPGYAHPLMFGWYRISPSHNLVLVDGDQTPDVVKSHVERVPDGVCATIDTLWSDLTAASRTLTVDGESVIDETYLSATSVHTYDWVFHSIGDAVYSSAGEDVPCLGDHPGYDCFRDIRRRENPGLFTARFTLESGASLTLSIRATVGMEIYTARTPGNPADMLRNTLIIRCTAREARFTVVFSRSQA